MKKLSVYPLFSVTESASLNKFNNKIKMHVNTIKQIKNTCSMCLKLLNF